MKAVLVFDIEGTTIDDVNLYAIPSIESISGKEITAMSDLTLRLLPEKKDVELYGLYAKGYNDCINEIAGETE